MNPRSVGAALALLLVACSSSPSVPSSSSAAATGSPAGSSGSGDGGGSGSAVDAGGGPCDPLAAPPTTLGTLLGVGEDTQSVLYAADEAPDGGGQDRVFVSSGTTLVRQHVGGTGQRGGDEYSFSFEPPYADAGDYRALLVQASGGTTTGMALGPAGGSRDFFGAPDAGQTDLQIVGASAVAGFAIQNLPNVVVFVADVSNGDAIVVTAPMDAWGTSGDRLFYGAAARMIEYPITSYNDDDYGTYVSFAMGSTTYNVFFNDPFEREAGPPGPGSLYTGDATADPAFTAPPGALTVTECSSASLVGFSFTCLGP